MKAPAIRATWVLLASIIFMLVIILLPGAAFGQVTPGSDIHLTCGPVYWASYSDYLDRQLTVNYSVSNHGSGPSYNTTMTSISATAGVTAGTEVPIWLGDMDGGAADNIAFHWLIPEGVSRFISSVSICSDCSPNMCVDGTNGGIDIKPGSCPNPINIGQGNAQVAVAVFSYGGFDALTLDESTVIFAGASPVNSSAVDKNGDGRLDMLYHFYRNDLDLQQGDSRACLSASIDGGGSFRSCDMVIVQ